MKPIRLIFTAPVILSAIFAAPLGARDELPAHDNAAATEIPLQTMQSLFNRYVASGKVPGIVAAIGRGDAPPVFVHAGNISDAPGAAEAGPDSLWRIYSMTKPITAIAAMILIEEGKLQLDEPISDFIPAFKDMRVLDDPEKSLESHPAGHPITVRHLLTHTSGLTYQIIGTGPLPREYKRLGLLGGRADAEGSKLQPTTLAEFADRVAHVPLLSEPGAEWNYSISMDVLGRVIEVASGLPFDRFLQARLFQPLGMNSTYWTVPQSDAGRLSTIYAWVNRRRIPIETGTGSIWLQPPNMPYGGSGLVTSARDYDRFLQMLAGHGCIDGVRILKPETVGMAMSNLLPPGVRVLGDHTPDTAMAEGFGAGGWVYLADVPRGVRAGTYGWFGAAGTIAFIDPGKGLRVTAMVNYFPGNKWPLQNDIMTALYSEPSQEK